MPRGSENANECSRPPRAKGEAAISFALLSERVRWLSLICPVSSRSEGEGLCERAGKSYEVSVFVSRSLLLSQTAAFFGSYMIDHPTAVYVVDEKEK
jgi:hypothetical protein